MGLKRIFSAAITIYAIFSIYATICSIYEKILELHFRHHFVTINRLNCSEKFHVQYKQELFVKILDSNYHEKFLSSTFRTTLFRLTNQIVTRNFLCSINKIRAFNIGPNFRCRNCGIEKFN